MKTKTLNSTKPSTVLLYLFWLTIFIFSNGFAAANSDSIVNEVQRAYFAIYGRPADLAGLDYWSDQLTFSQGIWTTELIEQFTNSGEYYERYDQLSDTDLIKSLYTQILNRHADPEGIDFYLDLLSGTNISGQNAELRKTTRAEVAFDILYGAANEDINVIENKLAFIDYFTQTLDYSGQTYATDDIPSVIQLLNRVDGTPESVQLANSQANTLIDNIALGVYRVDLNWTEWQNYANTSMATSQSVQFIKNKYGVPRPIILTGMQGGRIDYHNLVIDGLYGLSYHGRWGEEHSPTQIQFGAEKASDGNVHLFGAVAGLSNGTVEEWLNSRNQPGISPWASLGLEAVNTERVPVMSMECEIGPVGYLDPKRARACVVGTGTTIAPFKGGLYYFNLDLNPAWTHLLENVNEPVAFLSLGPWISPGALPGAKPALKDLVFVTKTQDHSKVIHWHNGESAIIYDGEGSITSLSVSRLPENNGLPTEIIFSINRRIERFRCEGFGDYSIATDTPSLDDDPRYPYPHIKKMNVGFDSNGKARSYVLVTLSNMIHIFADGKERKILGPLGPHNESSSSVWTRFNSDGALRFALLGYNTGRIIAITTDEYNPYPWTHTGYVEVHPQQEFIEEASLLGGDMNIETVINIAGDIDEQNVVRILASWNRYYSAPGWVGNVATWLVGSGMTFGPAGFLFVDVPLIAIALVDYSDFIGRVGYYEA